MALHMAEELELGNPLDTFQPKPFHNSMKPPSSFSCSSNATSTEIKTESSAVTILFVS